MKKTDIAMIIFIVAVSVLGSYLIVGAVPVFKDATKPVEVKTIDMYTAEKLEVDKDIFSQDAINPTVQVTIGSKE